MVPGPSDDDVDGVVDDVGVGVGLGCPCPCLVVMGRGKRTLVGGQDLFSADDHRDVEGGLAEHLLVLGELRLAFGASRAIAQYRFIFGIGDLKECVRHVV